MSVDRCDGLTAANLHLRGKNKHFVSAQRRKAAGKEPNQFYDGTKIAIVETLRAIVGSDGVRCVKVYDDPLIDNIEHAVIRLRAELPDEEVAGVMDVLQAAFATLAT